MAANHYFLITFRTDYIINVLFARECLLGKNMFKFNNNKVITVVSTHFNPLFSFLKLFRGCRKKILGFNELMLTLSNISIEYFQRPLAIFAKNSYDRYFGRS